MRSKPDILTCSALAVLFAGCATAVEQRVESGLTEAGVPADMASCMAGIWTEQLSVSQIRGFRASPPMWKMRGRV